MIECIALPLDAAHRLHNAINRALLRAWCATPSRWGRGTIRTKPKGPVRRNTFSEAVAAPTEKRGFVTPNFWGWCVCPVSLFWGVVGVIRKDARTASDVFLTTTLHPTRVETLTVALVPPEGAKTMTASPVASRSAAPTITPDLVQLHLQACNALAQALHTLRNSDCTATDLHRAIGRTLRAATAIKRMAGEVAA